MTLQLIGIGTTANDGTGDNLRLGADKINDNFTELYALQSETINAAGFPGATNIEKIQGAINQAVAVSAERVYIPSAMLPYDATAITFSTAVQMVREGARHDVFDVTAYGANGTADDGPAFNAARAGAGAAGGGTVTVPVGAYTLTTPFTFGSDVNILLWIENGATIAGAAIPDSSGTNFVIDLRLTFAVSGRISAITDSLTDNAIIQGVRAKDVTGAVIINKWGSVGKSAAYASSVVGAFGHEATTAWTVDQATAAFVQVVPVGSTTLTTVWRWTGTDAVPKTDNTYSLGVTGGRFKDVFCYKVDATTEVIVGGDPGTITNPLRVKAAGADAAAFYRATNSIGGAASGIAFYAGDSASASNVIKYGGVQGHIQTNTAGDTDGGLTFNLALDGAVTNVWRLLRSSLSPLTDNVYDLGTTTERVKAFYAYTGGFTTSVTSPIVQSGSATALLLKYNTTTGAQLASDGFVVGASDITSVTNTLRVNSAGATAAAFYRALNTVGGAASGVGFFAQNATPANVQYGGAQGYIDANTAGAHDGGVTFNTAIAGTVTNVWRILKGSFHPVTTNVYTLGTTSLRPSTVFGVLGNFSGLLTATLGVTVTGAKATLAATVAGYASANLPHGTAPSSPVDGDMWTTTAGLYVRINGATVGPLS